MVRHAPCASQSSSTASAMAANRASSALKIAKKYPMNQEADAIEAEILPLLERRMRRWLRRELVSVKFVQFSDLRLRILAQLLHSWTCRVHTCASGAPGCPIAAGLSLWAKTRESGFLGDEAKRDRITGARRLAWGHAHRKRVGQRLAARQDSCRLPAPPHLPRSPETRTRTGNRLAHQGLSSWPADPARRNRHSGTSGPSGHDQDTPSAAIAGTRGRRSGCWRQYFDVATRASGSCQPPVAGEQGHLQRLSERDV